MKAVKTEKKESGGQQTGRDKDEVNRKALAAAYALLEKPSKGPRKGKDGLKKD